MIARTIDERGLKRYTIRIAALDSALRNGTLRERDLPAAPRAIASTGR